MKGSGYWCCIITRDGEGTLGETLVSIFAQSLPPDFIVIVDDGSTDKTNQIVAEAAALFENLFVIHTASAFRDIRRVPVLLNLGIRGASRILGTDLPRYMMVSGDDNELSREYSESIIRRMDAEPSVVVASGSFLESAGRLSQMPHGAGRFIKTRFMDTIGGLYPVAYGWEPWVLYKALQKGVKVKNYGEIRYRHLRPYSPTNLTGWGRAMYSLGFPTIFVFLRFALNFVWSGRGTQTRGSTIRMMAGYLSAKANPHSLEPNLIEDEGLRAFVRRRSLSRIVRFLWYEGWRFRTVSDIS